MQLVRSTKLAANSPSPKAQVDSRYGLRFGRRMGAHTWVFNDGYHGYLANRPLGMIPYTQTPGMLLARLTAIIHAQE